MYQIDIDTPSGECLFLCVGINIDAVRRDYQHKQRYYKWGKYSQTTRREILARAGLTPHYIDKTWLTFSEEEQEKIANAVKSIIADWRPIQRKYNAINKARFYELV